MAVCTHTYNDIYISTYIKMVVCTHTYNDIYLSTYKISISPLAAPPAAAAATLFTAALSV